MITHGIKQILTYAVRYLPNLEIFNGIQYNDRGIQFHIDREHWIHSLKTQVKLTDSIVPVLAFALYV